MRSLLALGLLAAPAVAYEAAPPQSYAKPVGNKYVLVMLQPEGRDFKDDLRRKYGRSGLYPADDPVKPLWTCDWHAEYERNVAVSADGEWAVRVPDVETGLRHWLLGIEKRPVPKPNEGWPAQPAVFVYRNGKLAHTLAVQDLFDTGRFSDRDLFMGPMLAIDSFDAATGRVVVSTAHEDGRRPAATVEARTGEVTDHTGGVVLDCGNVPGSGWGGLPRWAGVVLTGTAVVGGGAAAVFGLAVVLIRRQGRR